MAAEGSRCRSAGALLTALAALVLTGGRIDAASAQPWRSTQTRTHPTGGAVFEQYLSGSESLDIVVALKLRNREQLDRHIRWMTTPGNSEYRRWFGARRMLSDFSPSTDQARAAANYLALAGFTNIRIEPNRLLIRATGTAAAARKAFNTELARFSRNGHRGIANTKDVQIPALLGDTVLSVLGLQTLDRMHPLSVRAQRVLASGRVHGINPVNFPLAYGAATLPAAASANVAIITAGSMTQTIADLHQFQAQNGLPALTPILIHAGPAGSDTSGTAEWDIDSQVIQAMSGGQLGSMRFYTATSLGDSDITLAINAAVSDNATGVINISLGLCERSANADGSMAADDQIFQVAVAQGQTVSVATGDSGSKECVNRMGVPVVGASYPASSPYVVAVGGTTLSTDAGGNYAGETTWSGTGGSPSLFEPAPSWQSGVVTGGFRGLPDLAFDGDPSSGAIVVVNGTNQQWGGTSVASPIFVGSWLRIQAANNARLGFPNTWIYSHGLQGTSAYHDVTSGSNGDFSAGPGWDFTSGFGSFDVAAANLLTRSSITVSASPNPAPPGAPVTLTATVTGNAPTGTVQFQQNGVNIGSPVTLVNGVATLTTNNLVLGQDAITAVYSGDLNDAGSTAAPFTETVGANVTTVPAVPLWGELLLAGGLFLLAARAAMARGNR